MQRLGEGLRSIKDILVTPKTREVTPDAYLDTLSEVDRQRIEDLSQGVLQGMDSVREGVEVGMIVFGSSIRPVNQRFHQVRDIDIRLISSAEPDSMLQKETIDALVANVGKFVSFKERDGVSSRFSESTSHSKIVEIEGFDPEIGEVIKQVGPFFLDYSNNDPSFEIRFNEGLPFHISITGTGIDTLAMHLHEERRQKQHFSLLRTFQGTKPS